MELNTFSRQFIIGFNPHKGLIKRLKFRKTLTRKFKPPFGNYQSHRQYPRVTYAHKLLRRSFESHCGKGLGLLKQSLKLQLA